MAYVKTNWQNGVTPVNADNMNKIENELEALDQAGGGTQLYKHMVLVNSGTAMIYLIDTNESQYTGLTVDFKSSLAKNLKYIELLPVTSTSTYSLPLFAELELIREGGEVSSILTSYYLKNKEFISFNISSIDDDTVTPL